MSTLPICAHCGEEITDRPEITPFHDKGVTTLLHYHHQCSARLVIGGLNHILHRCTCCGGTEPPDPPELTLRQSARLAVALWRRLYPGP